MARDVERDAYLREIADEYDVPMYVVRQLADMLGPNEDYDGLVTAVEDWADFVSGC